MDDDDGYARNPNDNLGGQEQGFPQAAQPPLFEEHHGGMPDAPPPPLITFFDARGHMERKSFF